MVRLAINKKITFFLIGTILTSITTGCKHESEQEKQVNFYNIPTFSKQGVLQAIVETPTGTTNPITYNPKNNSFNTDTSYSKRNTPLPYLGNYGFIPSTHKGNSAIEVFILADTLPTASIIGIQPIALIKAKRQEEEIAKIIAIPKKEEHQVLPIKNFKELYEEFPETRKEINNWLLQHNAAKNYKIMAWQDETAAWKLIEDSLEKA